MEKRKKTRNKQRLTCELVSGGERHPAIVRDISPTGFFAQTRVKPTLNTLVEVVFPAAADRPGFRVEAGVARHRSVPPRLKRSVPGGVGLEVLAPPAAYLALASSAGAVVAEAPELRPEPADRPVRTFRVRLTQTGRPTAKLLTIRCANPAGARARALTRAGRGWKVADLQEV